MIALRVGPAEVRFTGRADGDLGATVGSLGVDADVLAARDAVRRACGVDSISVGRQVHGAVVARAAVAPGYRVGSEEADGQATAVAGAGVCVHAADCLPVAVTGPGGVAMLHAGWRGLAAGVLGVGAAGVGGVRAVIGPGAGGCCYEAGEEVHRALGSSGRGLLDLKAVARAQLERLGVSVLDVGICTLCSAEFFSYRRDGPATGRQAGVAWLAS